MNEQKVPHSVDISYLVNIVSVGPLFKATLKVAEIKLYRLYEKWLTAQTVGT